MYLTDYHTHSLCSIDSTAPLQEMAQAAHRAGIRVLCTTDHYDLVTQEGEDEKRLDWTNILTQFREAQSTCPPDLTLRLGIELGSAQVNPQLAQEVVDAAPLDFVIGSIHNSGPTFGRKDLYFMDLTNVDFCHEILDDYLDQMQALAPLPCYDSMGHVIYPLRYMPPMGAGYLDDRYRDRFRTLFTTIIESGHGIEINTTRSLDLSAWVPVMDLYRQCGGEIVTVGSDAHFPDQMAVGIPEAQELLRSVGFRYHTIFQQRIPQFIKL